MDRRLFVGLKKLKQVVINQTRRFRALFDTTDEGEMTDYLGCLLERNSERMRLTQPVKIRRLQDKFGYNGSQALSTPVKLGSVLAKQAIDSLKVSDLDAAKYRTIVGILLHIARWTR